MREFHNIAFRYRFSIAFYPEKKHLPSGGFLSPSQIGESGLVNLSPMAVPSEMPIR